MADVAKIDTGGPRSGPKTRRAAGTTFGHLVAVVGMNHGEIAAYLGLSVASVNAYAAGVRTAPVTVLDRLATLWELVSYRSGEPQDLPPAAQARRQALQEIRKRVWHRKEKVGDDDEGED